MYWYVLCCPVVDERGDEGSCLLITYLLPGIAGTLPPDAASAGNGVGTSVLAVGVPPASKDKDLDPASCKGEGGLDALWSFCS